MKQDAFRRSEPAETFPRFGPAGNSEEFYAQGYKSILQAPGWLEGMGLTAYEYQCGHGVRTGEEAAQCIGCLSRRVQSVGANIVIDRGDVKS